MTAASQSSPEAGDQGFHGAGTGATRTLFTTRCIDRKNRVVNWKRTYRAFL